jgi:hypothetical protein
MCAFLTLRDKVIKPLLAGVVRPFGRGPKVLAAVDQHYVRLHEELNRTFHRARASLINSEDSDDCLQGPAVGRGAQSGPLVCAACALVAWSSRALLAIRPTACAERLSRGACRPPPCGDRCSAPHGSRTCRCLCAIGHLRPGGFLINASGFLLIGCAHCFQQNSMTRSAGATDGRN